ncbi:MAG: hypothetical protein WEB60_05680 [Terrimicrobiaceae bacterium]
MKPLRFFIPVALLLGAIPAGAELLVYSLKLDPTSNSVNYPGIPGGYLVVDEDAGSFSSVMILRDPDTNRRFYTTSFLSGSYFELLREGGGVSSVLSSLGGGSGTGEAVAFQAVGKTDGGTNVGGGVSLRVAENLRGFFMTNSDESSTTSTAGDPLLELGFAGASKASVNFESGSTRNANNARMTSATAITEITRTLERQGIRPEATPTPTPTPSPTPVVNALP